MQSVDVRRCEHALMILQRVEDSPEHVYERQSAHHARFTGCL